MPTTNLSEYVKHLRTIHFSLLIVSAALSIGILISPAPEISKAILQAQSINSIVEGFDKEFLEKYAEIYFESEIISKSNELDRFWFVEPGQKCPSIQIVLDGPEYTILPLNTELSKFIEPNIRFPEFKGSKIITPTSLLKFKELWNALRCNITVYIANGINPNVVIKPFIEIPFKDDIVKPPIKTRMQRGKKNTDVAIKYRFMYRQHPSNLPTEAYPFDKSQHIFMPLNSGRGSLLLEKAQLADDIFFKPHIDYQKNFWGQKALLVIHKELGSGIKAGKFNDVFPELDRITKNIKGLNISDIITVLHDQKEKEREAFTIFGTKIPFREYARIGIPFILLIQLYFLIHLKYLNIISNRNSTIEVPWIGLYNNCLPKIVTTLSAFLFPVFAVIIVGQSLHSIVQFIFIVLSIVISLISQIEIYNIWNKNACISIFNVNSIVPNDANSADAKNSAAD
jgi:hypothetical protein